MDSIDPLAIFLVSSGSRGDKLLFRYPFGVEEPPEAPSKQEPSTNPYALQVTEDVSQIKTTTSCGVFKGTLIGYKDNTIAYLLTVKTDLCGKPFEVKINDVLFVGYPLLLNVQDEWKKERATTLSVNICFALQAVSADEDLIICYQNLCKQLVIGLRHEELRCSFFEQQKSIMMGIQDDVATLPEDSYESPYGLILQKSQLAMSLRSAYESLCRSGIVKLHLNNWILVSFCLPQKVHNLQSFRDGPVSIKAVQKCMKSLRPFHAFLLLEDVNKLVSDLPTDASPALIRLVNICSPLKSLQTLALDADIALKHIYEIVSHLVYWGKATVIYPLCASNVYALAPNANTYVNSILAEEFEQDFPKISFSAILAKYSLPMSLGEHQDILSFTQQQDQQVRIVAWLLKRRLINQLHTYVYLNTDSSFHRSVSTATFHSDSMSISTRRHTTQLSPVVEDSPPTLKVSSVSDGLSLTSEGSPSQSNFSAFSTKSTSVEIKSNGIVITEETRSQWQLIEALMDKNLNMEQRRAVMNVPAANNPDDLKLFVELCPFFDGKHHLEEMMYFSNTTRSAILTVLDKFRDVLITCEHEDPGITAWLHV